MLKIFYLFNILSRRSKNKPSLISNTASSRYMLLLILLFSSSAMSAGYTWSIGFLAGLSSPNAACTYFVEVGFSSPTQAIEVLRITDKHFICKLQYWHPQVGWVSYMTDMRRGGTSCGLGEFFNSNNGECVEGELGNAPENSCAGNPINISNGNKYQIETDFNNGGVVPLSFTRTYNSLDAIWRHNYSARLEISGFDITLTTADGIKSVFNSWSRPATKLSVTELGTLLEVSVGWQYTSATNERFIFDSAGRLTQWRNRAGENVHLAYAGNLVTVTNDLGQSFTFTQDSLDQPLSLTADGLQISYSYNANNRLTQLTRTRAGQAEQRSFHYEDSRNPNWLTGITDERGLRYASWTYDDKGRATSSEHAGGVERTQVAYNADGSSTVTNELGKKATYRFQTIGGSKRVSAIEGEPTVNCPMSNSTFTYDDRGLLTSKTDNKGFITTYDYNARGLEISRTEATGTPQARTTTTTWHPELYLPLTVTEPGRITTYTYDTQGRQLSQSSVGTAL